MYKFQYQVPTNGDNHKLSELCDAALSAGFTWWSSNRNLSGEMSRVGRSNDVLLFDMNEKIVDWTNRVWDVPNRYRWGPAISITEMMNVLTIIKENEEAKMERDFQVPVNRMECELLVKAAAEVGYTTQSGQTVCNLHYYCGMVLLFNPNTLTVAHNSSTYTKEQCKGKGHGPYGPILTVGEMFAELCKPQAPKLPDIKVGDDVVEFWPEYIKVGCTIVSNETVKEIYDRINNTKENE